VTRAPLLLWVMAAIASASSTSFAAAPRYAVLMGQNVGRPHEARLQFAEEDAQKLGAALRKVGDFSPSNVVMVLGDSAVVARRAVTELNARIRREAPEGAVLLVYYSGHADAEALHFGDEDFALDELRDLVVGSPAALRLLVVDACRSGVLTEKKGGVPAPAFNMTVDAGPTSAEGFVVLTAASAGEEAQESPLLQGSFFTHHFVSGLLGAADVNVDGAVTLEEVTAYAYEQTVRQSSQTVAGTQHPRFSYDVRGTGSVVLTRPRPRGDMGLLHLPEGIAWLIFRSDGGVAAELPAASETRVLALPEASYFLRGRARDALYEGDVTVARGRSRDVDTSSLTRVDYARLVRKGGGSRSVAHTISVGYVGHTSVHGLQLPCHGGRIGYGLSLRYLTLRAGGAGCLSTWSNDTLSASERELTLDVGLSHSFDLPFVSLDVGAGGGAAVWQQVFTTRGEAPDRYSMAPFLDVTAGATVDLPWALVLGLHANGRTYLLPQYENPKPPVVATPLVLGWSLTAGWQF